MIVVGAYARVDPAEPERVRRRLDALAGVETFGLDDPCRIGILIEARTLDAAHELIEQVIPAVQGVLGIWPIFVGDETGRWDNPPTAGPPAPPAKLDHTGVQGV